MDRIALKQFLTTFTFSEQPIPTQLIQTTAVPYYINNFWTAKQRQASALHEISYRACFKPQLPRFFITLLTQPQDIVYDPFAGRGTTGIEAALLGRQSILNDVNPLSQLLTRPRIDQLPTLPMIRDRLTIIPSKTQLTSEIDLSMFYHENTLNQLLALREYLYHRSTEGTEDRLDRWIRMVATNRLTGHSNGFFSGYTLPPNQAVSPDRQRKINDVYHQIPPIRNIKELILRKSQTLLKNITLEEQENLRVSAQTARFLTTDAGQTAQIPSNTIQLTVTSPPFLNVVQYANDNWLRCWFNHIDPHAVDRGITMARTVEQWQQVMRRVFRELYRITRPAGWVAFEVGEVRKGRVALDETVIPLGCDNGFTCVGVLLNQQTFTKTANIWGITNNTKGTNTNRIVLFQRNE